MDTSLLNVIIEKRSECYFTPAHKSPHVLLTALCILNQGFGYHLRIVDVEERVAFLEGRYSTFKKITSMHGTHWDLRSNCITTDEGVWLRIIKENVFAQAYYYDGEPEYKSLCIIFGHDGIKTEHTRTLIIISDSGPGQGQPELVDKDSSSEDEVTSPPAINATKLRRRLFDDDAQSSIAPPAMAPRHYYWNWLAIDLKMKFPARNAFPPKSKDASGEPNGASGGPQAVDESSCASYSPFK